MNTENTYNNAEEVEGFISFLSDYGFKVTFGNETDTRFLRKALQALINLPVAIKSVTFVKNELSGITADGRGGVYDLACVDENDRHFLVEMQVSDYPQFFQRMKFYSFHKFNTMVKRGKYFFKGLEQIYCIGILAHAIFPFEEVHNFGLVRNQHNEIMDEQIVYITYELDKFQKTLGEVETDLDKLIFTMKHLQVYTQEPQTRFPAFWTEDWLDVAIKELDTRKFTPEQYMHYVMTLAKNAAAIEEDNKKVTAAKAEGKAEGITIGEQKGLLLTAKIIKLYTKGVSAAAIAEQLETELETVQAAIAEYEAE
jgi:predicted transposase/invertase (TIGR01784 family)